MKIVTSLNFDGRCREAFERYAEIFGGKIVAMMPFSEIPGGSFGPDFQDKIAHAWLEIGDQALMGGDAPPSMGMPMGGFSVSLHGEDAGETRRVFEALADGGTVKMPLQETFWSPCFGIVTDRFGTPWLMNTIAPVSSSGDGTPGSTQRAAH